MSSISHHYTAPGHMRTPHAHHTHTTRMHCSGTQLTLAFSAKVQLPLATNSTNWERRLMAGAIGSQPSAAFVGTTSLR
jgi:hypothetical protein